jgi:hypothetical protein
MQAQVSRAKNDSSNIGVNWKCYSWYSTKPRKLAVASMLLGCGPSVFLVAIDGGSFGAINQSH